MRVHGLAVAIIVLATSIAFAESPWEISAGGSVLLPTRDQASGPGTYRLYTLGVGADVGVTYDRPGPLYYQAGLEYRTLPTTTDELSLTLIGAQLGGGFGFSPFPWLDARLGVTGGAYAGVFSGSTTYQPAVSAIASLGFAITPTTSIGIRSGYDFYSELYSFTYGEEGDLEFVFTDAWTRSLAEGFSIAVGVRVRPGAGTSGSRAPRIEVQPPQFARVFPVLFRYYDENPLGSVRITNGERETIRNVRVSLLVNQYMDTAKESSVIESLAPGEQIDVPLRALFRESILGVTEGTSVAAEVLVEYDVGDERLTAQSTATMNVVNRNNMTWDDDRKAAAFVTANDPTVSRFARNVASSVRGSGATAVNERIRLAMGVFEAMRLFGMEYVIDPDSSYIELSENESALDYLQFPQQSLDFRTGDCDDLSILYSALLEALGIPTAFITIPGHLYAAFALGVDEQTARATFANPDDFIFMGGDTWMPVETTLVREDFVQAWATGAKQWRDNAPRGNAELIAVRAAWSEYPPTGFASSALDIAIPRPEAIVPEYEALLRRFVQRQIEPQVADLSTRIEASGGNARLANRLGALYAKYGLYTEAQQILESVISEREYRPALVNLGNLAYLRDELDTARGYYERAYELRPDDPVVLISLARLAFDQADYATATVRYREAEIIDPELAGTFGYIVSESQGDGRASAAQERGRMIWEEE